MKAGSGEAMALCARSSCSAMLKSLSWLTVVPVAHMVCREVLPALREAQRFFIPTAAANSSRENAAYA